MLKTRAEDVPELNQWVEDKQCTVSLKKRLQLYFLYHMDKKRTNASVLKILVKIEFFHLQIKGKTIEKQYPFST